MEENTSTSGGGAETSGSVENSQVSPETQTGTSGPDKASLHVQKILKEKQNQVRRTAELEAELKAIKEATLLEKQEHKTLAEMRGKEAEEWKGKYTALNDELELQAKRSGVKNELLKLGLNPEHEQTAFKLMGTERLKDVYKDPETGALLNAEAAAKAFHDEFKTLGGLFGRKTPGVSYDAPESKPNVGKALDELSTKEIIQRMKALS